MQKSCLSAALSTFSDLSGSSGICTRSRSPRQHYKGPDSPSLVDLTEKAWLLSLDAEGAFDRVAWDYLAATLNAIGLFPKMLGNIQAL